MNILVTGGLGYIGSHTVVKLVSSGYTPVIVDNLCNSKKTVLDRIAALTGVRPAFYAIDVRNTTALESIFISHPIDAVIHFAGLKAVGESVKVPLSYYSSNVYGAICVAEVMRTHQVKTMIFSSSATVYGTKNPSPYQEHFPTGNITSPYGWTKFMIERILMDLQTAEPHWSMIFLRYFNPVGAHPSGLMGEDPNGIPNNLMPFISQVAIGKRPYLAVYGNDYPTADGTCLRDYLHVEDLAEAHVIALKKHEQSGVHIYNLGTGNANSVLDVHHAYEQACGHPIPYRIEARRAGDIAAFWASADKAKQELGWQAKYSLADMARDSWNWQQKNPDGYPQESKGATKIGVEN